ncbi:MAG: anti-sigma factor [Nitrospirota bacterium]
MNHEEFEEAVPLYAVGALERTDRQALEAHLLSGCPSCHTALKEYQAVAAMLPYGLAPAPPPRGLKAKIMAPRSPADTEAVKRPSKPSLEPGEWMNHLFPPLPSARSFPSNAARFALAFAALLVVAGAGYVGWTLYMQTPAETERLQQLETALQRETAKMASLQREVRDKELALAQMRQELERQDVEIGELRDTVIRREAELDDARAQLAQLEKDSTAFRRVRALQDEIAALLRMPTVKVVSLSGSEMAKGAGGLLLYDPDTKKAWLYAFNLPPLPGGKTYQLWAVQEKPVSAGTFTTDAGQKGRLLIRYLPEFSRTTKFAVSLEPEGGRPQPTGAIYLIGQL